jgi:disease resistance protein RPM1
MKAPLKIRNLKKLQVLSGIESEGNFIKLFKEMTQLRTLGITNVKGRDERDLCISLQEMKLLTHLQLRVTNEEEFLRLNALSSPPPQLQRLVLSGKLESVPRWFCSLHSLAYLHLRWTRLEEDLLPQIEALPNLRWLKLHNACAVEELCFSRGFVKLTHLELINIPLLEKIIIEKGVMPNLQFLSFDRCTELKTIPEGFEYLTRLQTFYFISAAEEFYKSIEEGGVNHSKFRQQFPNMRM